MFEVTYGASADTASYSPQEYRRNTISGIGRAIPSSFTSTLVLHTSVQGALDDICTLEFHTIY